MKTFTVTVKDNRTGNTKTIECDAMFAGFASKETSGQFAVCNCTGFEMCLAANLAEASILQKENEDGTFAAARRFLKLHEKEIFETTEREITMGDKI